MNKLIETFQNIFKIDDLRTRIFFTAVVLIVVRVGAHITLPGVDVAALRGSSASNPDGLLGFIDLFVGGAFANAAIFALGIMPYISASIILQLGGVVIPEIQRMQREGEEGRRKLNQWTRYGTVLISFVQGVGFTLNLMNTGGAGGGSVVADPGVLFMLSSVMLLTAGTVFLMWLGEQITEKGIGNGISLIIMIGIIAQLPAAVGQELSLVSDGDRPVPIFLIILVLLVVVIMASVALTQGVRKIPVQYAKRVVGRKVYGGTTQYLPLKVNMANVMPIIFAQAIMFVPSIMASFFGDSAWAANLNAIWQPTELAYSVVYALIIIFFTYFYTAISFNPRDVADNMKKQGGFIPGIRPGKATAEYIDRILTRITLPGSIFLALIAILPYFVSNILGVTTLFSQFFGGTSLLIIVGVALNTLEQIESHLLMRHYDGFMKSGRMRGRGVRTPGGGGGF